MLDDQFGRDVSEPVVERNVLEARRLEHFEEHKIGVAGILDIVPKRLRNEAACVGESDLNRSDEKTMLKLMQERDDSKNSHPALIGEGHGEYLGAQAAFGVACGS